MRRQRKESNLVTRQPHGSLYFGGMTISRFTRVGFDQLELRQARAAASFDRVGGMGCRGLQNLACSTRRTVCRPCRHHALASILFKVDAKILECPRKRGQMQAGWSLNNPVISGRISLAGLPRERHPEAFHLPSSMPDKTRWPITSGPLIRLFNPWVGLRCRGSKVGRSEKRVLKNWVKI